MGGAVRDALLGIPHEDWDLATSATPEEVQALFKKTIPTGIDHGTVTVMVRVGGERSPVEVTTFRGEGAYEDGRRPCKVTFHRDLVEDLARRDFTVNAFAWDPVGEEFTDPFGGLGDLDRGLIRAVGDPAERFTEDGLRTMRAVRFCATREFTLDPATHDAIRPALPVLAKVSRERVMIELTKLLESRLPSRGLLPMAETGMWPLVLPELNDDPRGAAIAAVDALPRRLDIRLARLLLPADPAAAESALNNLKPSRHLRATVLALVSTRADHLANANTDPNRRRAAAALGRAHVEPALTIRGVDPAPALTAIKDAPLTPGELAIKGGQLIEAGLVKKGPGVRDLLETLLDWTHEDPARNTYDALLTRSRETNPERGGWDRREDSDQG